MLTLWSGPMIVKDKDKHESRTQFSALRSINSYLSKLPLDWIRRSENIEKEEPNVSKCIVTHKRCYCENKLLLERAFIVVKDSLRKDYLSTLFHVEAIYSATLKLEKKPIMNELTCRSNFYQNPTTEHGSMGHFLQVRGSSSTDTKASRWGVLV